MPLHTRQERLEALGRTLDILDTLRVRCPWDAKQTNDSLRPNTIEEVYELSAALLADDRKDIAKELGDVLLHILFYAKIGDEKGLYDIADVCEALNAKLIYRHPHIYGTVRVDDAHQVEQNWEQLKLKERGGNRRTLAGVPSSLPSLIKAFRIQEKAANVGFDWEQPSQVWDKVAEELAEVREALGNGKWEMGNGKLADAQRGSDKSDIAGNSDTTRAASEPSEMSEPSESSEKASTHDLEGEIGDLLFSVVNAARLHGINPDTALERTNAKFMRRFAHIEDTAVARGIALKDMPMAEKDRLWNEAKKLKVES